MIHKMYLIKNLRLLLYCAFNQCVNFFGAILCVILGRIHNILLLHLIARKWTYPNKTVMKMHPKQFSTQTRVLLGLAPCEVPNQLLSLWAALLIEILPQPIFCFTLPYECSKHNKANQHKEKHFSSTHFG